MKIFLRNNVNEAVSGGGVLKDELLCSPDNLRLLSTSQNLYGPILSVWIE